MKIVINSCFGGFAIPDSVVEELNLKNGFDVDRTDKRLVELVERGHVNMNDSFTELEVVEISDSATDWTIVDYDGIETIYYVVDGKIYTT